MILKELVIKRKTTQNIKTSTKSDNWKKITDATTRLLRYLLLNPQKN